MPRCPIAERVFSGMRPTGQLHIGHLVGALGNWVRLQDDYDCIYCVVDLHALTTSYEDVEDLRRNAREMVADWVAVGVDPERSIVFRQSDVHEHAELLALLGMATPLSWLERVPTYKGQIAELGEAIETYGFLGYPLLQTADIILYKATKVPVGQDQLPHLELAREVVRRMNHLYGPVFPEPQALLAEFPLVLGPDNRKMSKSYGNALTLGMGDEEIDRMVMSMITDPSACGATSPAARRSATSSPGTASSTRPGGGRRGLPRLHHRRARLRRGQARPRGPRAGDDRPHPRAARRPARRARAHRRHPGGGRRAGPAIAAPVLAEIKAAMGL